ALKTRRPTLVQRPCCTPRRPSDTTPEFRESYMTVWRLLLFWVLALASVAAAEEAPIEAISIVGNSRVEQSAIRVRIKSPVGKPADAALIEQDVRSIYSMGFFEDVQASIEDVGGKRTLTFHVIERPMIKEVKLEGNKKIKDDDLLVAMKVRPHTLLDVEKVQR